MSNEKAEKQIDNKINLTLDLDHIMRGTKG